MFDFLLPFLQVATDTATQQAVTTPPAPIIDPATAVISGTGVAAGIGAVIKSVFSDKSRKKDERANDFDSEEYRRLHNVEINHTLQNPTKTREQILAMSAYPESPALKTTLAEAYAKDYEEYKKYNIDTYYQSKL